MARKARHDSIKKTQVKTSSGPDHGNTVLEGRGRGDGLPGLCAYAFEQTGVHR